MSQPAAQTEIPYVGDELELFSHALNWKATLRRQISPFLGRRVLEVGAGIGATTRMLCDGTQEHWRCLEPDAAMARLLEAQVLNRELPQCCQAQAGTIADVDEPFDSLIYIDVLEHIPEDRAEIALAAEKVRPGGYIIVLSPAHQHLYTAFDKRIGHCRRYSKRMLAALTPASLVIERLRYLDCVGYFASLANRLMLRQSMPTLSQIRIWDGLMVPVSRILDPLLSYGFGKSVLCIWRKLEHDEPRPAERTAKGSLLRIAGLALTMLVFAIIAMLLAQMIPVRPFLLRRFSPELRQAIAIAIGGLIGAMTYAALTRRRR
jgi:SAM-dependent methyltransferase